MRWPGIFLVGAVLLGFLAPNSPSSRAPGSRQSNAAPIRHAGKGHIQHRHPAARADYPPSATSSRLYDELRQASSGTWRVSWVGNALTQLSGARLKGEGVSPESSAGRFLERFGPVLGLNARDLRLEKARAMEQNSQVIYGQTLHGLPVFGSRVNIIFDEGNNIIYLSSRAYAGELPSLPKPVSSSRAAIAASAALQQYLISRGRNADFPSEAELEPLARLGYELAGEAINLVYVFVVAIVGDQAGEIEIAVDAANGTPIRVRLMSRK